MNDQGVTVFVIDDDAAVRDSLTLLIEQDGYVVRTFDGAEPFLAACRPDQRGCAIIDLRMPGTDGMRLQEQITQRGMVLPVIFLTGHGDIPTSVRAIKAGAVDFLTKPVTGVALMASVRSALEACERLHQQAQTSLTAASLEEMSQSMIS